MTEADMPADTTAPAAMSETPAQLRWRMLWMYIWAAIVAGPGFGGGIVLAHHAFITHGIPFDQPAKLHILWAVVVVSLAVEAMLPIIHSFRDAHTRKHSCLALLIAIITGITTAWLASVGVGA